MAWHTLLVLILVSGSWKVAHAAEGAAAGPEPWDVPTYLTGSIGLGGGLSTYAHTADVLPVPLGVRVAGFHQVADGVDLGLFTEYRALVGGASLQRSLHELYVGAGLRLGPPRRGTSYGFELDVGASVLRQGFPRQDGEYRRAYDPLSVYLALAWTFQAPGARLDNGVRLGLDGALGFEFIGGGNSAERGSDTIGETIGLAFGLFLRLGLLVGLP